MLVERIQVPRAGTYPSKNEKIKEVKMQKHNKIAFSNIYYFCHYLTVFC